VPYDNGLRIGAYLLGYYPNYVMSARRALSLGLPHLPVPNRRRQIAAAVICGGPGPEAVALADVLRPVFAGGGEWALDVCIHDLHAAQWRTGHELTRFLLNNMAELTFNLRTHNTDVCQPIHRCCTDQYDIVIAQNCLNELPHVEQIAAFVQHRLAPGGMAFFVDQAMYPNVIAAMNDLDLRLTAALPGHCVARTNQERLDVSRFLPADVCYRFFDGPGGYDADGDPIPGEHPTRNLNMAYRIIHRN
jgi:hypothetical protein